MIWELSRSQHRGSSAFLLLNFRVAPSFVEPNHTKNQNQEEAAAGDSPEDG
jgi:hypothetical protein